MDRYLENWVKVKVFKQWKTANNPAQHWISKITILKSFSSILPTSYRQRFGSVLGLQWIPERISFLSTVKEPGSTAASWPKATTEEEEEDEQEVTVN